MGKRRKSDDEYKMMARTLRAGFIDPERTDDYPVKFRKGTTRAQAVRDLKRAGWSIGKELLYDEDTGKVTDVRRTGKIARGFTAREGYDLRNVDEWTPQQKQKLTRVYNQIKQLTERPYYVYRGRKPDRIAAVQEATSPYPYPKEVDIAFVPVARPGERPEVKFSKTEVLTVTDKPATIETVDIVERGVGRKPIYWEDVGVTVDMLRDDPRGAVKKMHEQIGAKEYSLMAGTRQQIESMGPRALANKIIQWQNDYPDKWPRFLLGVQAYTYTRQRDLRSYRKQREKAKDVQRKIRERERKAFKEKTKGRKQ